MTDQQWVTQKGNRIDDKNDYIRSRSQLWLLLSDQKQEQNKDLNYDDNHKFMITLGSQSLSETSNQVHNQEK